MAKDIFEMYSGDLPGRIAETLKMDRNIVVAAELPPEDMRATFKKAAASEWRSKFILAPLMYMGLVGFFGSMFTAPGVKDGKPLPSTPLHDVTYGMFMVGMVGSFFGRPFIDRRDNLKSEVREKAFSNLLDNYKKNQGPQ